MKVLLPLLLLALFTLPFTLKALASQQPALMLANSYRPEISLSNYWVSEKLDGVRAYWDGRNLRTRSGYIIHAPDWFIADFPAQPLDGELWSGRGRFAETVAMIRSDNVTDPRWQQLRYMVFDLPGYEHQQQPATFEQRRLALQLLVGSLHIRWLQPVQYFRMASHEALQDELAQVVRKGGEGLMLNRADSHYRAIRSDAILKLKPVFDDEAIVVGYKPGKGRYTGMVGSLKVRNRDGITFHVGSGLRDSDRQNPPPVGATITYAYSGETSKGKPRFPRFIRVRPPE
ncbi:MAG: DNA ligase [Marinobacterium sp.]|nr:DNA ligase [Marinobacterium sp.]